MKLSSIYIIIGIVLFLIIGFFIVYNEKQRTLKKELNKVRFTEISNLKQNQFSKVKGKVIANETPLIAPLSKKECVYYTFKIQEKKKIGKSEYWNTIHFDEQIQRFIIEENNELVLVTPTLNTKNFESVIHNDKIVSDFTKQNKSAKIETFLNEYDTKATANVGFGINIRAIEAIVQVNDSITVAGIVSWEELKKPIKGYSFSKIIALNGNEKQKLIITDLPLIDSKIN